MRSYEKQMQEAAIQNINPKNNAQFRDTKTARMERTLALPDTQPGWQDEFSMEIAYETLIRLN